MSTETRLVTILIERILLYERNAQITLMREETRLVTRFERPKLASSGKSLIQVFGIRFLFYDLIMYLSIGLLFSESDKW